MKKIGLIGEDPNDTQAIQHLLTQHFREKVHFKTILRNKHGHHLDNESTVRSLKVELTNNNLDLIIFIRDLDGLETEEKKLKSKWSWFNKLNAISNNKGLFLLNIYELEALILADIEVFNKEYKTSINNVGNVMHRLSPKELLKQKTYGCKKEYCESHCPELFKKIRYITVEKNCRYFKEFTGLLQKQLNSKSKTNK